MGHYVVECARAGGHDVVVLSRSHGIDLRSGDGLDLALTGVDAVIDVTNPGGADRGDARAFFSDITRRLQSAGAAQHVGHLLTLSIVGIERAQENPYYAAKLRQEDFALSGPVPGTILRATQFHEFPVQLLARTRTGTSASVPRMRVRSVAARTVATVLVELAGGPALGRATDLAGPAEAELIALAREYVKHFRLPLTVVESAANPGVPYGATLPGPEARLEGPTFEQWLESDDAATISPDTSQIPREK